MSDKLREALALIRSIAHDFDQTGLVVDDRFAQIEEMARAALAEAKESQPCVCCDAPARAGFVTCAEHAEREADGRAALAVKEGK